VGELGHRYQVALDLFGRGGPGVAGQVVVFE
jgi:hypothetical protein